MSSQTATTPLECNVETLKPLSLLEIYCSAVYSIFTSPNHPPVPDHLPTLIVTPHGRPAQILCELLVPLPEPPEFPFPFLGLTIDFFLLLQTHTSIQ